MPLLRFKQWLRRSPERQVRVRLADAGSRQDLPRFAATLGHRIRVVEETPVYLIIEITLHNRKGLLC